MALPCCAGHSAHHRVPWAEPVVARPLRARFSTSIEPFSLIAGGLGHTLLTLFRLLSVTLLPLSLSLLTGHVPAVAQVRGDGTPAA